MPAILSNPFLPPPPHFFTIALVVLSVNSLLFSSCYSIDEQGRVLLTWKDNLTSSSNALSSWKPNDTTPCSWFGVKCNSKGMVVEITLRSENLQGTLPSNFQGLKFLNTLTITGMHISGTIPKEIGDYNELKYLDLTNNKLLGKIPYEICRLKKLESLFLDSNELEGEIPLEIGNLSNLKYLSVKDNKLNGEIPKSIGMMKKLEILKAGGNWNLQGGLPMEIGNCSSLTTIGLPQTQISSLPSTIGKLKKLQNLLIYKGTLAGRIPEEIVECSELNTVYMYDNRISGPLPRRIGKLKKLQILVLWENMLEGEIPEEIGECSNLEVLDISTNNMSGPIPKSFGRLSKLREIQFSNNQLNGTIPSEIANCSSLVHMEIDNNRITGEIPVVVGKLKNLEMFLAWANQLTGTIPSTFSSCPNLQAIDLSYNQLWGPIPVEIFQLKKLNKLLLISNNLSGMIPPEIGNCKKLYRVRLNVNRFGGSIPSEIGKLKELNFLDLGENLLVGGIPPSLSKCGNLQFLDVHSNMLYGPFPNHLPSSLRVLDLSNNRLKGEISPGIGELVEVTKVDLSNNQLEGKIPEKIVLCTKLQYLDLGDNGFSGELPRVLGEVVALEIGLNLSCNHFSGEIPPEFSRLTKLGMLDLSYNNLSGNLNLLEKLENLVSLNISNNHFSGKLPAMPFFQNLPQNTIVGNIDLQFSSDEAEVSSRHNGVPGINIGREAIKVGIPILISISSVLFFLAIYMLIRAHLASSILLTECEKWEITLFQKLDFSIDDILQKLIPPNVIGTGSSGVVYRVVTSIDETMAVKKMWPTEGSGAFSSEIQSLGSIRHKNIIRLLGWGSNRNMKLLFYDYLPNGSLSSLIHDTAEGGSEWETRYEVLLGVAHALAYLHHDCAPPILHGDVKPMNVLLGHDFEPYLADFGLARTVSTNSDDEDSGNSLLGPQLAGSFGYMAPEQGSMMRITEKIDVYSFGVMIMEVLTARHPLDPTLPGETTNLVQWVQDHLTTKQDPVAILDSKLRGRTDPTMHEILQTLAVALLCVSVKVDDRPPMKDVVAMLEEIRHVESGKAKADDLKPAMAVVVQVPPHKLLSQESSQSSLVFFDDSN